jgi:hypothetical protein
MRSCFDERGTERAVESLWRANQRKLALSLLEALDHEAPLDADQGMLLTLLALRLRGVNEDDLTARLLMNASKCRQLLRRAVQIGLYDKGASQVTPLGKEFVARFRKRFKLPHRPVAVDKNPADYYPTQCEGKLRKLGKTDRSNDRLGPMES